MDRSRLSSERLPASPAGFLRARLVAELRRQAPFIAGAVLATLVATAALTAGSTFVQRAIDEGINAGDGGALRRAIVLYVVALAVGGLAGGVRTALMAIAGERFLDDLRVQALAGVLRIDLGRFERMDRGDLVVRVTADTEALSDAVHTAIPDCTAYVASIAAALAALALLSPPLLAAPAAATAVVVAAGRALRRRAELVYPAYRHQVGLVVGQLTETVEGADTVRAFGRQSHRLVLLRGAGKAMTDAYLAGTQMRNRFTTTVVLARSASTGGALVAASLLTIDGRVTIGTATACVLAVASASSATGWLMESVDEVLSAKAALVRVVATADVAEPAHVPTVLPARGELVLDGVEFAYAPGRPVLTDVRLHVATGERLALVGATGSGKSTIGRLAVGLARPDRGVVTYGGVDLAAVDPDQRRRLVLVAQQGFCVAGTLADNVRVAAPMASDGAIERLVDELGLSTWVASHPDGIHRRISRAPSDLSAGELQLVGLLRLAAADPAVVVFDESTGLLDPATEQIVGAAVDRLLAGRTVVVIAHRAETAARCDRVAVVANGRIDRVVEGRRRARGHAALSNPANGKEPGGEPW